MTEKEFSPLRSKLPRKPWPHCPDVVIFRCLKCGHVYQALDSDSSSREPTCCSLTMERIEPQPEETAASLLDYKIVGGYNQSAVQVYWRTKKPEDTPQWILLKTYTGGYIKYLTDKKIPPLVFPLADEDAYVYCDEDPCLQCVFRCKRGFIIYAYSKTKGLFQMPLDKMSAQY
ncbi:hypothetical protein [Bacillus sp. B15-48]|uniref:hypothetical protein n=1 Tax=Bacillus sp. B15-48 TaxID=1548601 RepID=UPI00193F100A|nr:hypothetical protein [Bacillus sp. B15-48]MBM4761271.1 hypothetical protein [Bacillus sp. B15-48]